MRMLKNSICTVIFGITLGSIVFAFFCNKNPMDGTKALRKGTVILKIPSLDSTLAKEAQRQAVHHMTASILNQGSTIQSKTVNKDAGNTPAQFIFSDLDPTNNLTAVVSVFDESNNEKYRATSEAFNITSGQTTAPTMGGWAFLIDQTKTEFTATLSSIPADGSSICVVKIIPKFSSGNAIGDGLDVSFNSTSGTLLGGVNYNTAEKSYSQQLKASTSAETANVSARVKGITVTKNVAITFFRTVSPTLTTINADSPVLPADGISKTPIRVIPKDYSGSNLGDNQKVTLNTTLGTIQGDIWYTSSDQVYSQYLQSATTQGIAEVTAIVNDILITNKIHVQFAGTIQAPLLVSPSSGASVNSPVQLSWSSVAGATSYTWEISTGRDTTGGGGFRNSLFSGNESSTARYVYLLAGTYYWHVASMRGNEWKWSEIWSFMIRSLNVTSPSAGVNWIVGTAHNITWTYTNVSDVKLEYSTNGGSSWSTIVASVTASAQTYAWTVPNTVSTNCLVRISSTSNLSIYGQSSVFSITAANKPPVIGAIADATLRPTDVLSIQVQATDPEGDTPLSYSLTQKPTGMVISSSGLITWTPGTGDVAGSPYTVTIEVVDNRNAASTKSFTVTVVANQPPVIEPIPDTTVRSTVVLSIQVQATDPEGDTPLSYSLTQKPAGMVISSSGLITWTPGTGDVAGSPYTVTIRVVDNRNAASTKLFNVTVSVLVVPIEPVMVSVSAGNFQMGDNFNDGLPDELPVHMVYLDAYNIGKYEVTNAEYKKFIDDGGYTTESHWTEGGYGQYGSQPYFWANSTYKGGGVSGNENFPIVGVSWFEATAYCKWISAKTGKNYVLPREAEWEKAARGTDQRRYPWGGHSANYSDDINGSFANYAGSSDPYANLTPTGYYNGSVQPSPCGAYDMAGNVWEWCFDRYGRDYYLTSPSSNPTGPSSTTIDRVIRGGSWGSGKLDLRSANREYERSDSQSNGTIGFRLVRKD